ncbi:MAG: tRNA (adenosine(37)-N6)-dimethylallyltransferase MiaA [Lachnoclostridium edouardi]|uniref:tRNA (adenosine(37)-N6)-dimethylallyltransferase MiaA n=1 Tax=Lachnoclostridium edouardi TaxID=1926283 RepID=UPI0026DC95E9|nr:tRNA (adenosine(37)-N6)-dimethylallyltransferase MiaA [Lachnoclostridium edouardi]MDO4278604.1 tRNA (adenosine(37)-N6)-dimethylallyltransferase MiaA [Lachnoclostridium edouardi]
MELSKNNNINRNKKLPLIVLTGPTAVGKTDLSVDLAKAVNGEIISADSMQVYRHMDIGSAKIKEEEMRGVPHHLINVLEPTEDFNVVIFKQLAQKALEDIYSRNKVPIIAGGTGFYIQALLNDIDFKENEEGGRIRKQLEEDVAKYGASWLHNQLCQVDPKSGEAIHENNVKRVIRALEYYQLTGQKISLHNEQEKQKNSPYAFLYYVLNTERSLLYERIDKRVDLMIKKGLVEEVKALKELGCRRGMTSMQGLGYKEILDYLDGLYSLEEAVYILKRDTRHFAKRQLTWFRREKDVRWLYLPEFDNNKENILNFILKEWNQMTGETNACLEEEK